ncbi:hypothetical protein OAL67_00565 [bacterium]|nr:hypothetical protein [bacterium]
MITFPQNDDWVYYGIVKNFLSGNFSLHPVTAPTFYTQGILGAVFSTLFSLQRLPVLTLVVSVLNLVVFYSILKNHFSLNKPNAILVSLVFFFNPLHIYSALGFMTENYMLLFLLLAYKFLLDMEKKLTLRGSIFYILCTALAFFTKQAALFLPLGALIYYGISKNKKLFVLNLSLFTILYAFYEFVFPKTQEMYSKSLQFHHLGEPGYVLALVFGSFVLLSAFTLPLFVPLLKNIKLKKIILILVAVVVYILLLKNFDPHKVSWGEFPYFTNTFERTGFYPRGLGGTKYHFRGIYDLYKYWDIGAKIGLGILMVTLFFRKKKIFSLPGVLLIVYLGLMVVSETFFDRYLVTAVPIFILFLISINSDVGKLSTPLLGGFVAFLIFFTYQFSMDFVSVNKYVWSRSEQLVASGVEPYQIQATNAWKLMYGKRREDYVFDFSFDSPEKNEGYTCCYRLVETKDIHFPMSIWVEPKVYLYEKL